MAENETLILLRLMIDHWAVDFVMFKTVAITDHKNTVILPQDLNYFSVSYDESEPSLVSALAEIAPS